MKHLKEVAGYLLGGLLFVGLMPTVMWLASGRPPLQHIGAVRASVTGLMMIGGLALSIWTIFYMRRRGKGRTSSGCLQRGELVDLRASKYEVAPRTQQLMTDGPYRLNRNPMLTGTLLYLAGVVVWLWTWQAALVWMLFLAIMMVQVISEEHRLLRDFGDEYDAYRRRTRRF